jgi:hypothetical protein
MKTLSAMLLLNKRTRKLFGFAVDPMRDQGTKEEGMQFAVVGSYYVLGCVTYQWTCFLFFSSTP